MTVFKYCRSAALQITFVTCSAKHIKGLSEVLRTFLAFTALHWNFKGSLRY